MATIKEDYCSKDIYRLLINKGFDGEVHTTFDKEGYTQPSITLQMAMKWLREVHKIYIDISPTYSEVEKTIHFIWQIFDSNYDGVGDCEIFYGKYETACEEAIKYSLKNLIK
jgi:hypothetical protein